MKRKGALNDREGNANSAEGKAWGKKKRRRGQRIPGREKKREPTEDAVYTSKKSYSNSGRTRSMLLSAGWRLGRE